MKRINVLFAGDFAPCRRLEKIVIEKKQSVLGDALGIIKSADISFVNLECPLTEHLQAINKSGPALKASPECAEALKDFSVVGLANNHILDYGKKGLTDTIAACANQGRPTVGAGENLAQAQRPFIKKVDNLKVAIIALAEHEFNQSENDSAGSAPIDAIDNFRQIREAQKIADIVIITLHGGNEYFPYPRPGLRKLCKYYIDLGVEAVICHHPHVPGAYEYHNGKPIVYSLGNFLFDNSSPPKDWDFGYMVNLTINSESKKLESFRIIPYKQLPVDGFIKVLKEEEKEIFLTAIERLRAKLEDNEAWKEEWHSFVKKKADTYILVQYFPLIFRGLGMLARNTPIARLFFNKSNSLPKLNIVRCQSHLELLLAALKLKSQDRND